MAFGTIVRYKEHLDHTQKRGTLQVSYKGDISPREAYERLQVDPQAVLIDVRTLPEWNFVGVPAVERLMRLSWQEYPTMQVNETFAAAVEQAGIEKDTQVFLLCRSGVRSIAAANALAAAGYENCYNVLEGFEGDKDADSHRGTKGGWKHAGLPWVQG
jgi:rhodanese-related sulfurtransferase